MGKLSGLTGIFGKTTPPAGKAGKADGTPDLAGKPAGGKDKTGGKDKPGSALDLGSSALDALTGAGSQAGGLMKTAVVGTVVAGGVAAAGSAVMAGAGAYATVVGANSMADMSKNLGGASALTPSSGANGTG